MYLHSNTVTLAMLIVACRRTRLILVMLLKQGSLQQHYSNNSHSNNGWFNNNCYNKL
jgi:hypothetical protein